MATQLEFGGLRSSIVVDGLEVPQYGIHHDEGPGDSVTSWIVSEPDKPFAINATLTHRNPGENYVVRIYLDGHKADGVVVRPTDTSVLYAASTRVSPTETRKFMFGSIELSDDDALFEASSVKALGEIKILLYKVGDIVPSYGSYVPPPPVQKVHERAKKGLAHSVKYGETQLDPMKPNTLHFQCLNETLLTSHIIRYRPLAMLQANGIVPHVPADNKQYVSNSTAQAPGPSSSGNTMKRKAPKGADVKPVLVLSDDDDDDIVTKKNGSKEQGEGVGRPAKRVKQEVKPTSPVEIIDLTI